MAFAVQQPNCTVVRLCRIGRSMVRSFHLVYCVSAWHHDAFVEVKLIHSKKCVCRSWTFCVVGEDSVWGKRGNLVLSAPILSWGKALWSSGFFSWELPSWQRQVRHTLARHTNRGGSCCSLGSMKKCGRRGRSQVSFALLCNSCRY